MKKRRSLANKKPKLTPKQESAAWIVSGLLVLMVAVFWWNSRDTSPAITTVDTPPLKNVALSLDDPNLPGDWAVPTETKYASPTAATTDLSDIQLYSPTLQCSAGATINDKFNMYAGKNTDQIRQTVFDVQMDRGAEKITSIDRIATTQLELLTSRGLIKTPGQLVKKTYSFSDTPMFQEQAMLPRDANSFTVINLSCPDQALMERARDVIKHIRITVE